MKAEQILALLDNIAPFALAEEWDNVGLLAGSRETEVETVLCALDLTGALRRTLSPRFFRAAGAMLKQKEMPKTH